MQMFVDGKSCRKAPKISKAYLDRGVSPIKTKKETEEEENKKILKSEFKACRNMFENVLEFFEGNDVCEVDWDEFNNWLDAIDRR